jgi:Domain of unknown function (DUF4350)
MTTTSASTSVHGGAHATWRSLRAPLIVVGLLIAVTIVSAVVQAQGRRGFLDPDAVDDGGSRAIANLLRDRGVNVRPARTTDAAVADASAGSTLVVAQPDLLTPGQLDRLAPVPVDLVLVAPGEAALASLAPDVRLSRSVPGGSAVRPPDCALPAAQRAGTAHVSDRLYRVSNDAQSSSGRCYPTGGEPGLVRLEQSGRSITVLGDATPLTNAALAEQGNAALALGLLSEQPDLVWYLPGPDDVPVEEARSFVDLLPDGVLLAAVQAFIAVLLLAICKARRLGPVVSEPLPVVVRAAEAVEGRARLYRRGRARDSAATALRESTLERLIPLVGLPAAADRPAVIDAVASRSGRPTDEVSHLLYGAAPRNDRALVRLADDLDALDREVHRS